MLKQIDRNKILREIQAGKVETIEQVHRTYPDTHWTELRYEKTGDTALHVVSRLGCIEIIKYLLDNYKPISVDCRNNDNKTPLHESAQFSQYEAAELLIGAGADVNALKKADWTPLMLACTKIDGARSFKTVELLLRNFAAVNYQNKDGWTALHLTAREGDTDILKLLVKVGLDVHKKTKNGRTGLHVAALHGHYDMVNELACLRVNVNDRDSCGSTALHEAVLGANLDICDLLLRNGADVDARNKLGFNLLHLAACQGDVNVIRYAVERLKLDLDITTDLGLTALHCAARGKKRDACSFLVECGANAQLKDTFGRLPVDYLNL